MTHSRCLNSSFFNINPPRLKLCSAHSKYDGRRLFVLLNYKIVKSIPLLQHLLRHPRQRIYAVSFELFLIFILKCSQMFGIMKI